MEEQTALTSAETGLTGYRGPVRPVRAVVPDQIGVAPIGHALVSWILLSSDMVVDMALGRTGAKSLHVPTPD